VLLVLGSANRPEILAASRSGSRPGAFPGRPSFCDTRRYRGAATRGARDESSWAIHEPEVPAKPAPRPS